MTSIKVKFRISQSSDDKGKLYYEVIHNRKISQILTDIKIFKHEWDHKYSCLRINPSSERCELLMKYRNRVKKELELFHRIIRQFDSASFFFTAAEVTKEFKRCLQEYTLFTYMERLIKKLKKNGKIGTSITYESTLNSLRHFLKNEDISLYAIDSALVESYEAYLNGRNVTLNTVSFYMRIFRAVYNQAVEDDILDQMYPFRHVYTGIPRTVKRAVSASMISKIRNFNLQDRPELDFARDVFILSFYLRGISLIDLAHLRADAVKKGYIKYRRRKTGQQLTIEWTKEMQHIVDKHKTSSCPYLLPIMTGSGCNERKQYRNMYFKINRNLRRLSQLMGMATTITSYVARHSWASVAQSKGINVRVISAGLGHESEKTTRIYLASLDNDIVDIANRKIINAV